jgi:hypothetical protein
MAFWDRNKRVDLVRAYKTVFSTYEGKQVLHDMMKTFHILHSTMDGNSHETAFKEGERSVVLRILRTINTDPSELEKILNEQEGQSRRDQ